VSGVAGPPPAPARRSHPPALLRLVEATLREDELVAPGDVVLCACSGGPDSSALLHALARLRDRLGFAVVAHGVDHGLRAEAPAELALAERLAASLDVPFAATRVAVKPGAGVQERARRARLDALVGAATRCGAASIATGHTADDRAETLLFRLLRGAGPRGLAVLPPRAPLPIPGAGARPSLVRPLIRARRADVIAHVRRHALAVAEDPSNRDPRYARARLRHEVLPLLAELSPSVVDHLAELADVLADALPEADPLEGLGRAQRRAVARALRLGRPSVALRLRGGREVVATFPDGRIVLNEPGELP
jgi:tRNA(Ile)-lysidine synthase